MYRTLIDVIHSTFRKFPQKMAYSWRENKEIKSVTYGETAEIVKRFSLGLMDLGVKQGNSVALCADVSYYWIIGNLTIQNIGAVDVPRGTDSTADELAYILTHSESNVVLVHHGDLIAKIEEALKKNKKYKVRKYIILQGGLSQKKSSSQKSSTIFTLDDILKKGEVILRKNQNALQEIEKRHKLIDRDSVASIIYTSGTTGQPKGVMLTQQNLVSQINILPGPFELTSADRMLTLLPPWHVFGRVLEYIFFEAGASIYYTDIKSLGDDMKRVKPTYIPAVPRVWEGIYNKMMGAVKKSGKERIFNFFKNVSLIHFRCLKRFMGQNRRFRQSSFLFSPIIKWISFFVVGILTPLKIAGYFLVFRKIMAATGGKLRGSISGGGALPAYIDEFFAAVGINIYEGYGLTETSPVLAVRLPGSIVPGTVGPLVPLTKMRLIDLEGIDVTEVAGAMGTLHVKGPQVMKGYFKDQKKTSEVLDSNGWFNTGDLVRITVNGDISIVGRSKDTIVLRGGENIEPVPIEDKILESPFIDQAMLVGQDEKNIGALIVVNTEAVQEYARENSLTFSSLQNWPEDNAVISLINKEIQRLNSGLSGFKSYERVTRFKILNKPFEVGDELSNTFKLKRYVVSEKYKLLIKEMYNGE